MPRFITDRDHISTSALKGVHIEHHGILGQKWGVRRFRNKDGSLTAAGKQRYQENNKDSSDDVVKSLESNGFKKDPTYGNYIKSYKTSSDIKHTIEVDLESGVGTRRMTSRELSKLVSSIEKNRDSIDLDLRKKVADRIVSDPFMLESAYSHLPSMGAEEKRKRLISDLGKQETFNDTLGLKPGYSHWRIMADGLGEIGYDDGGAYGDHYLMADIDWRTKEISKWISVNG